MRLQFSLALIVTAATLAAQPSVATTTQANLLCPATQIQMSSVMGQPAPGTTVPTSVSALNLAGNPCRGEISSITFTPTMPQGVYDGLTGCGTGLAGSPTAGPILVSNMGNVTYPAFSASITFDFPHTEFGLGVGDYGGALVLEFFDKNGNPVTSFTTPPYSTVNCTQWFRADGFVFSQVDISTTTGVGNFVITELWTQCDVSQCTTIGQGCNNSQGNPFSITCAQQTPTSGCPLTISCQNGGNGPFALVVSGAQTNISLGAIGAPGCSVFADPGQGVILGLGSNWNATFQVPFFACLATAYFQGVAVNPGANRLGVITSNGLQVTFN